MPPEQPQHKFRANNELWHHAGTTLAGLTSIRQVTITLLPGTTRSAAIVDLLKRITELDPERTQPQ